VIGCQDTTTHRRLRPRKPRPQVDPTLRGGAFNLAKARALFLGEMIPMEVRPDWDVGFRTFLTGRQPL